LFPLVQDLHPAMKMLGLNPMEQEIIDLTNEIARNGFIYFPEFCSIITRQESIADNI
jgi:Ca2+-binding EF-hand superfamily protein